MTAVIRMFVPDVTVEIEVDPNKAAVTLTDTQGQQVVLYGTPGEVARLLTSAPPGVVEDAWRRELTRNGERA